MTQTTAITTANDVQAIIQIVLDGLNSENSRRAYAKGLADFLTWYQAQGKPGLTKATVQAYKTVLAESGLSSATINLRMSAIRKLAQEAADNGLVDQTHANGIGKVKGVKRLGTRTGNWLSRQEAQRLINRPDTTTLKGLRDRAILAVMIGAGLRRSEVSNLTFDHVQMRDARWVVADLTGKAGRIRTVPLPTWAKVAIDAWRDAAGITDGFVFRAMHRGNVVYGQMTSQAVYDVVQEYAALCGFEVAAHDLRRTYAKLAHKGGSPLDQIQLSLGHASIQTTERYLGVQQDLTDAPCDHLGLRLE